jgi:dolichol-phosphate mannosyltransferase
MSMTSPRTLVVLATYNEIDNLPGLVDEIRRVLPATDLLVVDDNSPDGTGRWCDQRAATEPSLRCIHRAGKLGLGSATIEGLRYALDRDYDVVATMDADWSHNPTVLPGLVAATCHADVAIGSRYVRGGAIEGWSWHRRVSSRWFNRLNRALLRLPIEDTTGAFRAYRAAKLREIPLIEIRSSGYAYLEEILWHLARVNSVFAEVPITFRQRHAGRSKLNAAEAAGKLFNTFRLALHR